MGGRGDDFTLAAERRSRNDLKAALYDEGRLKTRECAPATDELFALDQNDRDGKVYHPQSMVRRRQIYAQPPEDQRRGGGRVPRRNRRGPVFSFTMRA